MKNLNLHIILSILFCGVFSFNNLQAQSVDSLLRIAFNENPELRSKVLDFEAAVLRSEQVSQLSSPTLGVATPISPVETRLGPQVLMVSASQMLPWFGTLSAREDVAVSMSKAVYENYSALKLEVEYSIRSAYLGLQLTSEKKRVLQKKETILKAFRSTALSKVESGKSTIADVLRIEVQLKQIETELLILDQQFRIYEAQINKEIRADITSPIILVESLKKEALDSISIEKYREKIQNFHPLLRQIDALIEKSEKEQKLSSLSGKPQLAIGMDYGFVNERTDASPVDNGRDIFIPKVMISIPIYRKTYSRKIQEEQLIQESLENRKEAIEDKMILMIQKSLIEIKIASLKRESALSKYEKTDVALDVLMAQYSNSGGSFDELLQLINELYAYELEQYLATADFNRGILEINRISNF